MWRIWKMTWAGLAAMFLGGCVATGPLLENPVFVRPDPNCTVDNPVYVPLGPSAYGMVFEKVIDVVDDYFEISRTVRHAGLVETFPRVAPGLEQFWRPGNPDCYDRLRATFQTIRQRAVVLIDPAADGGYFIQVTVYKELEDLARPSRSTAGAASFQNATTVERQFEVVDPSVLETGWVPLGRNCALEQLILQRLKKCM